MKNKVCVSVFIIQWLILFSSNMQAQNFTLTIHGTDSNAFKLASRLETIYSNYESCRLATQEAHSILLQQGYLTASIDSFIFTETHADAYVQLGKIFTWASLKNINIPVSFLNQLNLDETKFFGKKVDVKKLTPLFEKVIRHFEDNGHPFASLKLDSVVIKNNEISANLFLNKGPQIHIDSIYINEEAKISRKFLLNYLGLADGMLYDESKMRAITTRMRELPFLQELYPWRVSFTVAKSSLNLYVKNKSANRADVLIGLQPNTAENQGKFLLTGDIKLGFQNALGRGEKFQLNWSNLQFQSPRYNIDATYPYLFNSAFGLQGKFDFYKKDSSFRTIAGELGIIYQFNANNQIKLFYELSSNRLGTVNIQNLLVTKRLPDNADVSYKTFGFEGVLNRVDYKLNPRKGFRLQAKAGVAFRNFIRNTTVEQTIDPTRNEGFGYLYDSIQTKSYRYNFQGEASYFHPITKRIVLANMYRLGFIYSNSTIYRNELFQLGGYRMMRGFDEGSLFVNQYHVFTFEPRFLLSLNSYFFAFSDVGYIQSNYNNQHKNDFLYSGGLGMTFETKAGLFNLSYAVGGQRERGIEFKNSKIHFGYINIF
jgi:outer membrane translocation and assembly module TamA